jgi:hypothetical protein
MGNNSDSIRQSKKKGNKGSFTAKIGIDGKKLRTKTKKKRRLSNHAA